MRTLPSALAVAVPLLAGALLAPTTLPGCASDPGGDAPELLLAPDDVDFGVVRAGCETRERYLCLYDTGATPAVLQAVSLVGDPAFVFTSVPPTPTTLPAGGKACMRVAFRPTAEGVASATLRLTVEGLSAPLQASLVATATSNETQTDTFVQLGRPQADLLIVLDDSAATDDLALEANLRSLAVFARDVGVDARAAVATTSATDNGALLPFDGSRPGFLSSDDPRFVDDLLADVEARPRREDTPDRGLEAALRALLANRGLLRPDAALSVVLVSPTDDASVLSTAEYVDGFLSIKGLRRPNLFSFSFIGGGSGCTTEGGTQLAPAPRYLDVQRQTGGVFESACTTDWSRALESLSMVAFGYRTRFFLSNVPVPGTIEVTMTDAHGTSWAETAWVYDASSNSIDFDPFAVPGPGSTIEVGYEVACP